MSGVHRKGLVGLKESASLPQRQSYLSPVWKDLSLEKWRRGTPGYPYLNHHSPLSPKEQNPDYYMETLHPPLQSGAAMLLKFWAIKWNQECQEDFSKRHLIRKRCTLHFPFLPLASWKGDVMVNL